jgi:hypothetical protein
LKAFTASSLVILPAFPEPLIEAEQYFRLIFYVLLEMVTATEGSLRQLLVAAGFFNL